METQFSRNELVLGEESTSMLASRTVAVFGLGGVGSFAVEALARSGIGSFVLVDSDAVGLSNLNRQLFALHSTIGRMKTDVACERILDINPLAKVETHRCFFEAETAEDFDFTQYDYVLDCIDIITSKILLVSLCREHSVPLISSMGTGNKKDPSLFRIADISQTSICPLARVMRRELAKRHLGPLKVLFSIEEPLRNFGIPEAEAKIDVEPDAEKATKISRKRVIAGSLPFVPPVAGLMIAGEVVKDLLQEDVNISLR